MTVTHHADARLVYSAAYGDALAEILTAARHRVTAALFQVQPLATTTPEYFRRLWRLLLDLPSRNILCNMLTAHSSRMTPQAGIQDRARLDLVAAGWHVRQMPRGRLMHAKYWLVDDHTAMIGSHNLSAAAVAGNVEASVIVTSPTFSNALAAEFAHSWTRSLDIGQA
jgi:phosphatidylserine/phosphatidylglycerophosphate/cardiolipin synthase-like enzyme